MKVFNSISGRGLYRSRNGILFGVCRGLADYFDFSVFWIRAIAVILFIFTGFWPVVGIYLLAALLMKSEPAKNTGTGSNHKAGSRYRCSAARLFGLRSGLSRNRSRRLGRHRLAGDVRPRP